VHARTAKQTEGEPADFSIYSGCVETGKRIVANGDIRSRDQVRALEGLGLYGAMIGRAAVENPRIFAELRSDSSTKAAENTPDPSSSHYANWMG
jgi:tRNA-dihydrouridine synthase